MGAKKSMPITKRFEENSFEKLEQAMGEFIKTNPKIKIICSATSAHTGTAKITSSRGIIGEFNKEFTKYYAFIIYEEGE